MRNEPSDAEHYPSTQLRGIKAWRLRQAGLTFHEIGERLGVGRERARQLSAKGWRVTWRERRTYVCDEAGCEQPATLFHKTCSDHWKTPLVEMIHEHLTDLTEDD